MDEGDMIVFSGRWNTPSLPRKLRILEAGVLIDEQPGLSTQPRSKNETERNRE